MEGILRKFVMKYGRLPTERDPDYLEMLRMSKYRIKDVPDVQPGKCANCGASKNDGRGYVDIGLQIDWYGALFLCGECLKDIASTAGLFTKVEADLEEAREEIKRLQVLHEKGVELHETIVRTAEEIKDFYVSVYSSGDNSASDSTINMVPIETAIESESNGTEQGTTESTTVSRRKNVRSLTDLLNESK